MRGTDSLLPLNFLCRSPLLCVHSPLACMCRRCVLCRYHPTSPIQPQKRDDTDEQIARRTHSQHRSASALTREEQQTSAKSHDSSNGLPTDANQTRRGDTTTQEGDKADINGRMERMRIRSRKRRRRCRSTRSHTLTPFRFLMMLPE